MKFVEAVVQFSSVQPAILVIDRLLFYGRVPLRKGGVRGFCDDGQGGLVFHLVEKSPCWVDMLLFYLPRKCFNAV